MLCKSDKKLNDKKVKALWGGLYKDIDLEQGSIAKLWVFFFLFRRLILVTVLYYSITPGALSIFSLSWLLFLLGAKPQSSQEQLTIEACNEGVLYVLSYFMIIFSEFNPELEVRYLMGWVFVGIFLFAVAANLTLAFYNIGAKIMTVCKQKAKSKAMALRKQERLQAIEVQKAKAKEATATDFKSGSIYEVKPAKAKSTLNTIVDSKQVKKKHKSKIKSPVKPKNVVKRAPQQLSL